MRSVKQCPNSQVLSCFFYLLFVIFIKEKDSEVGVLDTTSPVVAMEDGSGTFQVNDIAGDGYDDEWHYVLQQQPG